MTMPDPQGFFGEYGGQFVPAKLKAVLDELAEAYSAFRQDPAFEAQYQYYLRHYCGRPSPLYECRNLSNHCGGARVFLKREDLNHLGAHKINNTLGQGLIAKRLGKNKLIAETGAGQHGVATAATAALLGMECDVYMGSVDAERQKLNVFRMEMMGARVIRCDSGQRTLKEAVDDALSAWIDEADRAHYVLGSAVGPHPYPWIVREFQRVIGREARAQMLETCQRLPDICIACVGGGSNAVGLFSGFVDDASVQLVGVEPAGTGLTYGNHAATMTLGTAGVMHGFRSYMLTDDSGAPAQVSSCCAGLDYPGVGPELAYLKDIERARFAHASDQEAIDAFFLLSRTEGIIAALESCHAVAHALSLAPSLSSDAIVLINLSGRGDKDVEQVKHLVQSGQVRGFS